MKSQKPFTLLKRPPQRVWYYKLPGEKTRHSTGLTVKTQAEQYVVGILKGDIQQSRSQRLGEFTKHLFIRGECNWIERSEQKGWIITREMAQMRRGHLANHILPEFKDQEVSSITSAEIDDWLLDLDVANATKNHIMDTFRVVLDEAKRAGLVKDNAARQIKLRGGLAVRPSYGDGSSRDRPRLLDGGRSCTCCLRAVNRYPFLCSRTLRLSCDRLLSGRCKKLEGTTFQRSRGTPVVARHRSPFIDLPLKITLTTAGVEWFVRNHKKLKRLPMADNRLAYGIAVTTVPASSLQKMINIDYIAEVELARSEFSSKSQEIIDLTKLIVHRLLFKKFENETFRMLVDSALIKRWNRQNPGRCIDMETTYNQSQLDSLFASIASEIPAVSLDIQEPLIRKHASAKTSSEDERRLRDYLSDGFVLSASRLLWCVLAKSRGQPEYESLVEELRGMLEVYIEKAVISEYLALMVVEFLGFTEVSHYQQVAGRLLRGHRTMDGVMADETMRAEVRRHMEAESDLLSLTYQIGSKGASVGTDHRLRVTICNQERRYQRVKEQLEALIGTDAKGQSLLDFSRKIPRQHINAELGFYNISYLQKECEKQNVRVEISMSQVPRSDLTLINLTLLL